MYLYQVLLVITIAIWLYILWTRRKFYLLLRQLPSSARYSLLESLFSLKLCDNETVLQGLKIVREEYGDCAYIFLGSAPMLCISEPQIMKDILTSPHCVNKSSFYDELEKVTGAGLFTLKDPEWSRHRRLLSPAFGDKVLRSFIPIFNEHVDGLVKVFDELVGREAVDIYLEIHSMTLSVGEQTLMGMNGPVETSNYNKREIAQNIHFITRNTMKAMLAPWHSLSLVRRLKGIYKRFKQADEVVKGFIENAVAAKLKSSTTSNASDKAPKNMLINRAVELYESGEFSLDDVKNEVFVTTAAAFDTTANTIFYAIMLLAMFPEYQEKLFEELKALFPDISNMPVIDFELLKEMTYLDMIVNETMRLITPVPLVGRRTMQTLRLSNGVVLPPGIDVALNIFHMHRRKDIWGARAHTFYPEHFLPAHLEGIHPYAFIPFTKGLRNCIGWRYGFLSLKIYLAKLLRAYRFTTNYKFEDLEYVSSVSIKLREFPLFEIHKREN